jgi:hypothetical protein
MAAMQGNTGVLVIEEMQLRIKILFARANTQTILL